MCVLVSVRVRVCVCVSPQGKIQRNCQQKGRRIQGEMEEKSCMKWEERWAVLPLTPANQRKGTGLRGQQVGSKAAAAVTEGEAGKHVYERGRGAESEEGKEMQCYRV